MKQGKEKEQRYHETKCFKVSMDEVFVEIYLKKKKKKKDKMDGLVIGMFLMAKQKSLKTK